MKEIKPIERIELLIKKEANSEKLFTLNQCDYNFSSNYYSEQDEQDRTLDVNLSGTINEDIDTFFLEWMSNHPGDWSGSLKVYHQNQEVPSVFFNFEKAIVTSLSQSFVAEDEYARSYSYFNAILSGVVLNDVKIN